MRWRTWSCNSAESGRGCEGHLRRRRRSAHRHARAGTKSAKVDTRKTQMKIDNSSATSSDEIRPAMFVPHSLHYAPPVAAGASRCSLDRRPISVFDPSLLQPVRSQPLARAGEGCGLKRAVFIPRKDQVPDRGRVLADVIPLGADQPFQAADAISARKEQ